MFVTIPKWIIHTQWFNIMSMQKRKKEKKMLSVGLDPVTTRLDIPRTTN